VGVRWWTRGGGKCSRGGSAGGRSQGSVVAGEMSSGRDAVPGRCVQQGRRGEGRVKGEAAGQGSAGAGGQARGGVRVGQRGSGAGREGAGQEAGGEVGRAGEGGEAAGGGAQQQGRQVPPWSGVPGTFINLFHPHEQPARAAENLCIRNFVPSCDPNSVSEQSLISHRFKGQLPLCKQSMILNEHPQYIYIKIRACLATWIVVEFSKTAM